MNKNELQLILEEGEGYRIEFDKFFIVTFRRLKTVEKTV